MYRLLLTVSLLISLFGCEMAGEAKNVTTGGAEAFSCDQIRAAFSAYDADRSSFEALGVCAVESIPTAKAPQRSIFLFFFVA